MKDEIKEILDFKENADYKRLSCDEIKVIEDYITNLQQDNEMYAQLKDEYEEEIKDANDSIIWWTNRFKAVERDNRELKQENERLKEENNNKAMNDYAHDIDESWYRELYDDYKSRCEKAVEFIKENVAVYAFNNKELPHWEFNDDNIKDLLNILQNGSDE